MATTNGTSDPMPEWLDDIFVAAILRHEEGRPVTINKLRVARAVGKGDNYASLLLRVGVEYSFQDSTGETPKTTSLIVKTLPTGEIFQEFVKESGIFPRELKMYSTTIPAFEALLNENTREKVIFAPKALRCDREYIIVLKDLKDLGYSMCNRHIGMDLEHSTMVLRNLARFHAASVALHEKDPEAVDCYKDVFYVPDKRGQIDNFVTSTLESVAKEVDSWDDPQFAGYAEKIRHFAKTAIDQTMEITQPSKTFLNVLNHGDCWVNNSLFRYAEESGRLEEMRFIDFQLMRYASPSLDLQYFLYTSVQADVRDAHWRDLLDAYVKQLRDTLTALGHGDKAITVEELEADMDLRASFGLISAFTVLCAIVADPSDALNMEDLKKGDLEKGDTKMFAKAMSGKRFKEALQRLLPMFVKRNVL